AGLRDEGSASASYVGNTWGGVISNAGEAGLNLVMAGRPGTSRAGANILRDVTFWKTSELMETEALIGPPGIIPSMAI
ncbi:MAG TPA: hypothetical protein VGR96_12745, partial [Acidobacteriaceae bacterium]|nr:hypothetical protein [Acidobacteriaceae bacterium]